MSAEIPVSSPPDGWQAQSLQLVVFTMEPQSVPKPEWFSMITGLDAETVTKKFRREDSAEIDGRQITLVSDLARITWGETAIMDADNPPVGIPSLGPLAKATGRFGKMVREWLPHCPPIHRLGLTGRVLRHTPTRIASYELLDKYLQDVKVDGNSSSDFLYRINRRRKSITLPGRDINRLSTWTSMKFSVARTELVGGAQPMVYTEEYSACSIDLDINTSHETTEALPHECLIALMDELLSLGVEIAEKGDIP